MPESRSSVFREEPPGDFSAGGIGFIDADSVDMEGSVCVVVDAAVVTGGASSQGRCAMEEDSMMVCGAQTGSDQREDLFVLFSRARYCE